MSREEFLFFLLPLSPWNAHVTCQCVRKRDEDVIEYYRQNQFRLWKARSPLASLGQGSEAEWLIISFFVPPLHSISYSSYSIFYLFLFLFSPSFPFHPSFCFSFFPQLFFLLLRVLHLFVLFVLFLLPLTLLLSSYSSSCSFSSSSFSFFPSSSPFSPSYS